MPPKAVSTSLTSTCKFARSSASFEEMKTMGPHVRPRTQLGSCVDDVRWERT